MNKLSRYLLGITIGVCAEYLLRVGFSIYPVIIIGLSSLMILIDTKIITITNGK